MTEDAELLRRYAADASEPAFAEVVRRHLNFVYACALRRVGGDSHLAEDVTQHVFSALARQAGSVARHEVLSGWLYLTTRNAAAQLVRGERRRHVRESTAALMNELHATPPRDAEWEQLRPVLDNALDEMSADDRQAVLLRFFEGKSYADIGARLRLAENTARMRVERALDKLRSGLERRGVTSTGAGLAVALANQAGIAAPAGLAASVTSSAVAASAVGSGAGAGLLFGLSGVQAGVLGALACGGVAAFVVQANGNAALRQEIAALQVERTTLPALRAENRQLVATAAEVAELRRDDVEFQQLSTRVTTLRQAQEQRTRAAQAQALDRKAQLAAWLREQDKRAQDEVDRMNKEGNLLVVEFKNLTSRSKDASLTIEARAEAEAAAKAKLTEIQAKQREIQAYKAEAKRSLEEPQAELRRLEAATGSVTPGVNASREAEELKWRAAEIEQRRREREAGTQGTLILGK